MTDLARLKRRLALAAFAVPVIVYPLIYPGSYPVGVGIIAGAMAAGTVGFVLLLGYAHQLAFGQAGFLHGRRLCQRDPERALSRRPVHGAARSALSSRWRSPM